MASMKSTTLWIAILATSFVAGFTLRIFHSKILQPAAPGSDVSTPGHMYLEKKNLELMEARAATGDVRAMEALYDHFEFADGDPDAALRWSRKLADKGSLESQQYVLSILIERASTDHTYNEEVASACRTWLMPDHSSVK